MPVTDWDAIVVGAGPAGAALACRLRPQRRVLLLDRAVSHASARRGAAALPRIGESLPAAARVLLQRCGAFDRFVAAGHVERGATISQWESDLPVWFDPVRDPNGPGWHLDRTRFDADMRAAAAAAGALLVEVRGTLRVAYDSERWSIDIGASGPAYRAPVLVDATGRSAAVARQLGMARRIEDELICLHAYLPADAAEQDRCTRVCTDSNGWWYSVRVPSGQRVLAFHLDADDAELHALMAWPALREKARRHALLAEVLPAVAAATVHARPAGSAVLDRAAQTRAAGFFAIGDAGLSFDPIASQGIFHALASAESAAAAIARGSNGSEAGAARDAFLAEMASVHAHYRQRLRDTYAAPPRYRHSPFWSRRRDRG